MPCKKNCRGRPIHRQQLTLLTPLACSNSTLLADYTVCVFPRPKLPFAGLDMLDAAYHRPFDLCPVDAVVQLLVHQPYGAHVVAAHNVHAEGVDR